MGEPNIIFQLIAALFLIGGGLAVLKGIVIFVGAIAAAYLATAESYDNTKWTAYGCIMFVSAIVYIGAGAVFVRLSGEYLGLFR